MKDFRDFGGAEAIISQILSGIGEKPLVETIIDGVKKVASALPVNPELANALKDIIPEGIDLEGLRDGILGAVAEYGDELKDIIKDSLDDAEGDYAHDEENSGHDEHDPESKLLNVSLEEMERTLNILVDCPEETNEFINSLSPESISILSGAEKNGTLNLRKKSGASKVQPKADPIREIQPENIRRAPAKSTEQKPLAPKPKFTEEEWDSAWNSDSDVVGM
jgi:hypothetical protein